MHDFKFKENHEFKNIDILIIGNPPWVTNTKLSRLNSENLPQKINYKNFNGLDALTGKSNFDISETITIKLIEQFNNYDGQLALLLKNSTIKNILFEQKRKNYCISNIKKINFNALQIFDASVDASLFFLEFNKNKEYFWTIASLTLLR